MRSRVLTAACAVAMPILVLASSSSLAPSHAVAVQDDSAGTWFDELVDTSGLVTPLSGALTAAGGAITLAGASDGTFTTKVVTPPSFAAWGKVRLRYSATGPDRVRVAFVDAGGTPHTLTLVGSSDPGFDAEATIPVTAAASPSGAVRVTLVANAGDPAAPRVEALQVTWAPRPGLRIDLQREGSTCSGATQVFEVPLSVSHVDARDVLVTLPLADGALVPDFGFDDRLELVTATHGGGTTGATPLTIVPGVSVPAHHAFWYFASLPAGRTLTLRAHLRIPRGTLDDTAYALTARAQALNAITVASAERTFLAQASVAPRVQLTAVGGVYDVGGERRALPATDVRYRVRVSNDAGATCGARWVRGVAWVPLAALRTPMAAGPSALNGLAHTAGAQSFHGAASAGHAVNVAADSVLVQVPTLAPGASWSGDFTMTLKGLPPLAFDQLVSALARADSGYAAQAGEVTDPEDFRVGISDDPRPRAGKGDKIDGRVSVTYGADDNAGAVVGAGDHFSYMLDLGNEGTSVLRGVWAVDRLPTTVQLAGVTASVGSNAVVWYATTATQAFTLPASGACTSPGGAWSTTSFNANTKSIAVCVPAIASSIIADPSARPTRASVEIAVIANPATGGAQACLEQAAPNTVEFRVSAYEDLDTGLTAASVATISDSENVRMVPRLPSFAGLSVVPDRGVAESADVVTWTVTVPNEVPGGRATTDDATSVTLDVTLPRASVDGTPRAIDLVSVDTAGGQLSLAGLPNTVRVSWSRVAALTTRTVRIATRVPRGIVDGAATTLAAVVQGSDNTCGVVREDAQATIALQALPDLALHKEVDFALAEPGDPVTYTLSAENIGTGAALDVVVFDEVPDALALDRVVTSAGERCWFSDAEPPLVPPTIDADTLTLDWLLASGVFIAGDEAPAGTFTSPFGPATRWLACALDETTLTPPQLRAGALPRTITVATTIRGGTDDGVVIRNQASIDASDLLLAVSDQVETVIADDPSIAPRGECPAVVANGEDHTLGTTWTNRSSGDDVNVVVSDVLPAGFVVKRIRQRVPGAAAPIETEAASFPPPEITLTALPGGATQVTWQVSATLERLYDAPADVLGPLQSVRLEYDFELSGVPTDGAVDFGAEGSAENVLGTQAGASFACVIAVRDPNPGIALFVDRDQVLPSEVVTFTMLVRNRGLRDSPNTLITDVLPADFTYLAGSTRVLTPDWQLAPASEPFTGGPATLAWDLAHGNAFGRVGGVAGDLPAGSDGMVITFQATASAAIPSGVSYETCADIAIGLDEHGDQLVDTDPSDNHACVSIRSPNPDPAIDLDAPAWAFPGDRIEHVLRWANVSRRAATNVVAFYRVPDIDGDGDPDLKVLGATLTFPTLASTPAAVVRFSAQPLATLPTYDPALDGDGNVNWKAAPSLLTGPVTWVAFDFNGGVPAGTVAGLSGTYRGDVALELRDPVTSALTPTGSLLEGHAEVAMLGAGVLPDEDLGNNSDDATTRVPGVNVALDKVCDPAGRFPGVRPRDAAGFDITVHNVGSVTAYGVRVEDVVPSWLTDVAIEVAEVEVVDFFGRPTSLVDDTGAPRTDLVRWVQDGGTFTLGAPDAGDATDYREVGLPSGASVVLSLVGVTADQVEDEDLLSNVATVHVDTGLPEEDVADNSDGCDVVGHRPDPAVAKTGADLGGSPTRAGDTVAWTVTYDNLGGAAADDVVLTDPLPDGVTFVAGSLSGAPIGTTVEYLGADGAWGYVPTALGPDPQIRGFRLRFASFAAPLDEAFTQRDEGTFAAGTYVGTRWDAARGGVVVDPGVAANVTPTYTSPAIPTTAVTVGEYVRVLANPPAVGGTRPRLSIINAATSAVIVAAVALDAGGSWGAGSIDVSANPRIKIVATFRNPNDRYQLARLPTDQPDVRPPLGEVTYELASGLYLGSTIKALGGTSVVVWRTTASGMTVEPVVDGSGTFPRLAPAQLEYGADHRPSGFGLVRCYDASDVENACVVRATAGVVSVTKLPCPSGDTCAFPTTVDPISDAVRARRATTGESLWWLPDAAAPSGFWRIAGATSGIENWIRIDADTIVAQGTCGFGTSCQYGALTPGGATSDFTLADFPGGRAQIWSWNGETQVGGRERDVGGNWHAAWWDLASGVPVRVHLDGTSGADGTFLEAPANVAGHFIKVGSEWWVSGSTATAAGYWRPNAGSWLFTAYSGTTWKAPDAYNMVAQSYHTFDKRFPTARIVPVRTAAPTFSGRLGFVTFSAAGVPTLFDTASIGNAFFLQGMLETNDLLTINSSYAAAIYRFNGSAWTRYGLSRSGYATVNASNLIHDVTHRGVVSARVNGSSQWHQFELVPDAGVAMGYNLVDIMTQVAAGSSNTEITHIGPYAEALPNGCWGIDTYAADRFGGVDQSNIRLFDCVVPSDEVLRAQEVGFKSDGSPAVRYETTVADACQGVLVNTAQISTSSLQIRTDNDAASASLVLERTNLAATVTTSARAVQVGDTVTLTLVVDNLGPDDAADAEAHLTLPAGLVRDPAGPVDFALGTLVAGARWTTDVIVRAQASAAGAQRDVSLAVMSATTDCTADDDVAVEALIVGGWPNVWVTVDGPGAVPAGTAITYTITVGNNGNVGATGVVVTNTIPSGYTTTDPATFVVGALPPGGTQTYTVTVVALGCGNPNDYAVDSATVVADVDAFWDDNADAHGTWVYGIGPVGTGEGGPDDDCDEIDDNCDGVADNEADDGDGDGATVCVDCDDDDASVHPGATETCTTTYDDDCDGSTAVGPEVCNGADDDCDGDVDEGFDADGDGERAIPCGTDCNDGDAAVNTSASETCTTAYDDDCDGSTAVAPETCNGVDDDCDGAVDEDFDGDGDGVAGAPCGTDCDDDDGAVYPGATERCVTPYDDDCDGSTGGTPEVCNGVDDDCDGEVDEGVGDGDGDGFLAEPCGTDCDDGDIDVHPGASDGCDGIDTNCDGTVDEGFVPEPVSCGSGEGCAIGTGFTTCEADGTIGSSCGEDSVAAPDPTCDERRVAYAIVTDASGRQGTIRCWEWIDPLRVPRVECETEPGTTTLRVVPELYCSGL